MLNAQPAKTILTQREVQERLWQAGLLTRHDGPSGATYSAGKVSLGGRQFDETTNEHRRFIIYLMSRSVQHDTVAALFDDAGNVEVSDVRAGPVRPFIAA